MKKGVFVQTFPFVKRESLSEEKTRQKKKSVKRENPSKEKNSSLSAGGFPACHVKE